MQKKTLIINPLHYIEWSVKHPFEDNELNSFSCTVDKSTKIGMYFQKSSRGQVYEVDAIPLLTNENIKFVIKKYCNYEPYKNVLLQMLKREGEYLILNTDIISMRVL
ncbi:hypothetical protein 65p371 [Aeromonas phage 65]|uniref:Uncharacterized protein n=1 Tax=Aeromonas phage 65 TaxID=2919549 RepID=E5DSK5_9CAUD|nr:hypothetical protein ST65p371 [Aeromonas phage 65]ADQ53379.1 hypothetical protein 65p371 [Aeromonas phage 65]